MVPGKENLTMPDYDLSKIRKLLNDGFTAETLRSFCLEESEFRDVYYEEMDGVTKKSEIVQILIKFTDQQELFDLLLDKVQIRNPGKYTKYAPYKKESTAHSASYNITEEVKIKQASNNQLTEDGLLPTIDFLIVTALEEERDAVLDKLPGYQQLNPTHSDIRVYYQAEVPVTFPDGSLDSYKVILISLLGMGRVQATISTVDAIRRWQPRFVMLVGIAGGIAEEGIKLGDVLVSDQIVDYELQKLKPEGPDIRWQVHQTSPRLREIVRNFSDEKWHNFISISRPIRGKPKRHIGPIISGDKVIASSEVLKQYRTIWSKLIGVEMEGGGVAVASFQAVKPLEFLMVRGVSDLADEQKGTPKVEKWRAYACHVAAAYAISFLQSGPVLPLSNNQLDDKKHEQPNIITIIEEKWTNSDISAEPPYGMMSPDSPFYIERKADQDCWQAISGSRPISLYIQAPRQMGKSSLMYRMLDHVKKEGLCEFAYIDFQVLPEQYLKDDESFFKEFCRIISRELEVPETVDQNWVGSASNIIKCSDYVSEYLIPKIDKPIIVALDELERTLESPFRTDFFGMLRGWYTRRVHNKNFTKLRLFLSSSTDPYLLIKDPNQSPFNVARRIILDDFTLEQVSELNERHGVPLGPKEVSHLTNLLGGHPYLTRLAFYLLQIDTIDFNTLLNQATEDHGPFGDHLSYYYLRLLQKPDLKQVLLDIYHNQTCEKTQPFYQLQEAGLIKQKGQKVVLRNELYHRYFQERLNV